MKYNPQAHRRRSIRLKDYDYSQAGFYFVTICCKNHQHYFGQIYRGVLNNNASGKMIQKWYYELENKFPDVRCHEMVVMPNHFHCIIENVGTVGATLCGRPNLRGRPNHEPTNDEMGKRNNVNSKYDYHGNGLYKQNDDCPLGEFSEHVGSPLYRVVGWFKTMSTNEYIRGVKNLGWKRFDGKLWQRNYWEHIIRDDFARQRIAQYIVDNPRKWKWDKFYD